MGNAEGKQCDAVGDVPDQDFLAVAWAVAPRDWLLGLGTDEWVGTGTPFWVTDPHGLVGLRVCVLSSSGPASILSCFYKCTIKSYDSMSRKHTVEYLYDTSCGSTRKHEMRNMTFWILSRIRGIDMSDIMNENGVAKRCPLPAQTVDSDALAVSLRLKEVEEWGRQATIHRAQNASPRYNSGPSPGRGAVAATGRAEAEEATAASVLAAVKEAEEAEEAAVAVAVAVAAETAEAEAAAAAVAEVAAALAAEQATASTAALVTLADGEAGVNASSNAHYDAKVEWLLSDEAQPPPSINLLVPEELPSRRSIDAELHARLRRLTTIEEPTSTRTDGEPPSASALGAGGEGSDEEDNLEPGDDGLPWVLPDASCFRDPSQGGATAGSDEGAEGAEGPMLPIKIQAGPVEVPPDMTCPITREIMHDPVIALDGFSYEREAIAQWFSASLCQGEGHLKSPLTNETLDAHTVTPNHTLRKVIENFVSENPDLKLDLEDPDAFRTLGVMYFDGKGVTPSWRRAREYWERAIELGNSGAVEDMQNLNEAIQEVTIQRSNHSAPSSLVRNLMLPHSPPPPVSHVQVAPLMDKRVEIHGTSRADFNGMRGAATDFHPMGGPEGDRTTWRYTVKLDGGEAFKFKRTNVRA